MTPAANRFVRLAVLPFLCLAVAATTAHAARRSAPPVLTFAKGHFVLAAKPFFPVMALSTFCPAPATVDSMAAFGVNMIDGYALACQETGKTMADAVQKLEASLRGKVLWKDKTPSPNYYPAGLAELVDWQASSTVWDNRDGSQLVRCVPSALAAAYAGLAKTSKPTIVRIPVARDAGLSGQSPACLNANYVDALAAVTIAAGGDGIEFLPQSRGNASNNPSLLFDVPPDMPAPVGQQFARFSLLLPAVLNGKRATTVHASANSVKLGAWRYNNKLYVLAVNTSTTKSVKVTLAGLDGATAEVIGEATTANVRRGAISATFSPLAVHIYRAALRTAK